MEQSFTDDAPLFPVFERHMLAMRSVIELCAATLPYASTHEFSGMCLNIFNLSLHITNAEEWETPFLGNFGNRCLAYAMQ